LLNKKWDTDEHGFHGFFFNFYKSVFIRENPCPKTLGRLFSNNSNEGHEGMKFLFFILHVLHSSWLNIFLPKNQDLNCKGTFHY